METNIELEILQIAEKERINYEAIFEGVKESQGKLRKQFFSKLKDVLIKHYLNVDGLDELARVPHLKRRIKEFKGVFNYYLGEFGRDMDTADLEMLKKNVVAGIKSRVHLLEGFEQRKLPHPIEISCQANTLYAIFDELSKLVFSGKELERRIAHLVADNFISKDGAEIDVETPYKKLMQGGITESAREKAKAILQKMVQNIN